eukprot:CAMPEP_0201668694 /NCGR_PEP_ID=MMETSP0494-20130426/20628_1 /ASSEMBLY_ACC=CAM_ASM_000839 /TAXON_ID=420259 /ORGANISM="Thalassiosira gravida, Strain GMp14c1" /LENGTH=143 /DNA_ID=CAMNT_0048149197 /DNA_START=48 /DNA_END=476 /DNA_ORIENTATION=-
MPRVRRRQPDSESESSSSVDSEEDSNSIGSSEEDDDNSSEDSASSAEEPYDDDEGDYDDDEDYDDEDDEDYDPMNDALDALIDSVVDYEDPNECWDYVREWLKEHSIEETKEAVELKGEFDTTALHVACRNHPPLDVVELMLM